MSYKIRIPTKKKIIDPIEVAHLSERLLDWYEDNQNKLLWGVIIIVLLGLAILGWGMMEKKNNNAALLLAYEASKSIQDAQLYEGDENAQKEAYKSGISQYEELIQEYPRTRSSALAQFRLGNSYVAIGEFKKAISTYQALLKRVGKNHKISPLVIQRLGLAYVQTEEFSKAEENFMEIAKMSGASNQDQALFELALLYESKGQEEKALAHYEQISKDFPASPMSSEALAKINSLKPAPELEESPSPDTEKPEIDLSPTPSSEGQ